MELQVERGVFAEETGWVSRVLPTRPTNPVLVALLMEADETGNLSLSGTDQEASSRTVLRGTVKTPGKTAVSGRLLADIAKNLPNKPVRMKLDGSRLLVECGRSLFRLPTFPVEEYPNLPESPTVIGSFHGDDLTDGMAQVVFAAAKDDAMPVLSAIYTEFGESETVFAATDRYRMAVKRLPWQGSAVQNSILLRAKTVNDLTKNPTPFPVKVSLDSTSSLFGIASGDRRSTMPIMDGSFPDFKKLIPSRESTTIVDVDVVALMDAARRVRLVADRPNIPIKLQFGNSEVFLSAGNDIDAGANEPVECKIEGDASEIAFNPEYLLEGLSALRGSTARFHVNGSARPALLRCPDDESYEHVLMPVRLNN